MTNEILLNVHEIIRKSNDSRLLTTRTDIYTSSVISQTAEDPHISPVACIGFAVIILTTVIGNTLVLAALFLDKRLHTPSFFLIANMAIADLLLGLAVLPFSSVLELLNNRWIFGKSFCSAWLALDVLCCTASIIGLAGVSIDRYIGVTRPLKYSSIMTIRRTIYLIITIWAASILTSVVPLFGLTDRGTLSKTNNSTHVVSETCEVNKNTFYTLFSSAISFYIPVIILLILYSRIYQEAKKQGTKLENEKRRLYEIDYQIASEHLRQQQNQSNGHSSKKRNLSNQSDDTKNDVSTTPVNSEHTHDEESSLDRALTSNYTSPLKKNYSDLQNNHDDDGSHSGSSLGHHKNRLLGIFNKGIFSTIRRNSGLPPSHLPNFDNPMTPNDELLIIKHKLHNLRAEKKAFRTVGLILGALLICWLPFFVTLPLMSILKEYRMIEEDNTTNIWFKITFWLGYVNSALNPFVYAFSNRAIRRAFREVIFRRFCCCICRKRLNQYNERKGHRRRCTASGSFTTETSQIGSRRKSSYSADLVRTIPKIECNSEPSSPKPIRSPNANGLAVSFAEFLSDTNNDDDDNDNNITSHNNEQSNSEFIPTSTKKNSTLTSNS
ncbi:unnamed protein product [Rotaria sordida]|uniref:G-protein coupled receptors family 1 profile domain-containing protein n=1 Tax=Rotaria sordida TaxID=392033 RepID=A0A814JBH7_9BILA|nr:unnamed protein product [Rotaria sordida]